ncbi:MAG TPA: proton-conducting transporter membrane subunit [Actinomycetota bacterium]|nr:proton-conducting transporter membrane subunit [Actinomycetota bacterium]
MTVLAWVLPGLPLGVGTLLTVFGRRADRLAPAAGVGTAAAALAVAAAVAAARPRVTAPLFAGIPAGLAVDGLSAVLALTVTVVTLAVLAYATGELDPRQARARFFGLMLVFAGSMLVTVTATGLAVLLMAWEVMGATSYGLIGYWWREPRRVRAATVAFLTTRAADLGLYLAAGCALAGAGSLALDRLPAAAEPWLALITLGVVLAALGKSAQLPFSFWLSRAMEGPSPVSALLHSAAMVAAGAYLLLRLDPLLVASGWGAPAVAVVGAVTALALGAVAVAQHDLKQLLAASTCSQIGFMVLAAGAGGVAAGTAQLVAHAATKSLLFLAAGAWLAALGTKDLQSLRGAARRYPVVGATFTVGALSLAGVPPLSLWVTKDEVLAAALRHSPVLYALALAAVAVSALYAGKALAMVWLPAPPDAAVSSAAGHEVTGRIDARMRASLVALAALAGGLGVLGLPPVAAALERALGSRGEPAPAAWELALSATLAAGAVWLAYRWRDRLGRLGAAGAWLTGWLRLEDLALAVVARPTMGLASALARGDDRIIDGVVRGAAAAGRLAARLADARLEWTVDGAVRAVGGGARRLGALARRPQTGQLHTYYAQAVAALAVLALIFVLVR